MGSDLRKGWEVRKLGEVCEINPKKSEIKGKEANLLVSFLPMKDLGISQNRIVPIDTRKLSEVMGSYTYFADNDILLAKVTPCFENGKLGIAKNLINGIGFGSSEYIVFRPLTDIVGEYIFYLLSSEKFQNNGKKLMFGACGLKRLSIDYVKKFPILIPPLQEQQKIVTILDEAFTAIAKAKENAELNLQNAKELFESYLQGVFENKGEGWEEKSLKDITTKIGSGATPRGGQANYKEEGISLIRSMNIHDFEFREKKLAFIDETQAKALSNVILQTDDVLLNITGASIARCCILPKKYLPARVNQHVSIIRANQELINPLFLASLLTSKFYKRQILEIGEQGATRQAITKVQLENFTIAFPKTIKGQKKVINQINTLQNQTKKLESIYTKKLQDLEELKKSILQKAFNGELI